MLDYSYLHEIYILRAIKGIKQFMHSKNSVKDVKSDKLKNSIENITILIIRLVSVSGKYNAKMK